MLIKQATLEQIVAGRITLAFRRWRRPTVRAGGTLRTAMGMLAIEAVDPIDASQISETEARQAGFEAKAELVAELRKQRPGQVYRIRLKPRLADPTLELRQRTQFTAEEFDKLLCRLAGMDSRSACGPWTSILLRAITESPGTRAADLAEQTGFEKEWLKGQVSKFKKLGLTISLSPGYHLSPRGAAFCRRLRRRT